MGEIKPRVMHFKYMIAVNVTILYTYFQMKMQVSLKVMVQLIYYWSNWSET